MRPPILFSLFLAAAATTAAAEPTRTVCYAGTQKAKVGQMELTTKNVLERTYDPDKNEIRQRTWSDKDPSKEVALTGKVDPATGTFTIEDPATSAKGTGKLEGKPWHWTGLKLTMNAGGATIESTSTISDTEIHQEAVMSQGGQPVGHVTGELVAFDCKQLDKKKAELAKPADTKDTKAPAKPAK